MGPGASSRDASGCASFLISAEHLCRINYMVCGWCLVRWGRGSSGCRWEECWLLPAWGFKGLIFFCSLCSGKKLPLTLIPLLLHWGSLGFSPCWGMQILVFTALDLCRVFLGIALCIVLLLSLAEYTCTSPLPHCHITPWKARNGGGFEQRGGGRAAGQEKCRNGRRQRIRMWCDHHHSMVEVGRDIGGHLAQALAQAEPARAAAQECVPMALNISKDRDSTTSWLPC